MSGNKQNARTFQEIYTSMIKTLGHDQLNKEEILEGIIKDLKLTDEELNVLNTKGKPKFKANFYYYLNRAVAFNYVSRHNENGQSAYSLTEKGSEILDHEKFSEAMDDIRQKTENLKKGDRKKGRSNGKEKTTAPTEEETEEIIDVPLNLIMYGPPGTGKTYNTFRKALEILGEDTDEMEFADILAKFNEYHEKGRVEFITFHQSYCYEEFIEGIRPKVSDEEQDSSNEDVHIQGTIEYELRSGVFKKFCNNAKGKPGNYVFIIDEINRGNVSRIFGELITLIEEPKRIGNTEGLSVRLPYSQRMFGVPNNVYIIGTMNTADRSLVALDSAIRRRFEFEEMWPQYGKNILPDTDDGIDIGELLREINRRISEEYDTDHCIGHAYLIGKKNGSEVAEVFEKKIVPLLKEYFYDDLEKIVRILAKKGSDKSDLVEFKEKRIRIKGGICDENLKRIYS